MLQEALDYLTTADSWWGRNGLVNLAWNHTRLSVFTVLAAMAAAIPPALWLGHRRRGGMLAVTIVNLSRAIPTFAIIALVFPFSLRYGFGLGFWPTFVALFFLALPPIFVNTFTGVSEVDSGVVEAARAMGMRDREVLLGVELPAAMPLVAAGVRISAVQVVATTTLGALVGFRCLGSPILQGLATRDYGRVIAAASIVAFLSLLTEGLFAALARRLSPWNRSVVADARDRPDLEPATAAPAI